MSASRKSDAWLAARALADLNTFATVVTILEGGHLMYPGGSSEVAQEIIEMCKDEQRRLLAVYDDHIGRAQSQTEPTS